MNVYIFRFSSLSPLATTPEGVYSKINKKKKINSKTTYYFYRHGKNQVIANLNTIQ